MSPWQINIVSAFGRGEALALALKGAGFEVQILDFTAAFSGSVHHGFGPFPIARKSFMPEQEQFLEKLLPITGGLSLWLKDGPIELTGPLSATHADGSPALSAWKNGLEPNDFARGWLRGFLQMWASPYFTETWDSHWRGENFPTEHELGYLPERAEDEFCNFERAIRKGIPVQRAQSLGDVRTDSTRLLEIEVQVGSLANFRAPQWIWCLSAFETRQLGEASARSLLGQIRNAPDWAWVMFSGKMQKGYWTAGFPTFSVLLGDVHLPWAYANTIVLQRQNETGVRLWMKVPRMRMEDMEARRSMAMDAQNLLQQRMPFAGWTIDPVNWKYCPHSEIYNESERDVRAVTWKNCWWVSPQTLPRLDFAARFEREASVHRRLVDWRETQLKKQGAGRDQPLHPA